MTHLADSDWVVDHLKGSPPAVALINRLLEDGLAISVITFGEVYEGIYYGRNRAKDERVLAQFLKGGPILDVTRDVARQYAIVRGALRQQGMTIPPPDLLIAATAIHHNIVLATRNLRHYERIPGLRFLLPDA